MSFLLRLPPPTTTTPHPCNSSAPAARGDCQVTLPPRNGKRLVATTGVFPVADGEMDDDGGPEMGTVEDAKDA